MIVKAKEHRKLAALANSNLNIRHLKRIVAKHLCLALHLTRKLVYHCRCFQSVPKAAYFFEIFAAQI